ncbi:MAG: hypothetical protein A2140_09220 [Candidatus Muproteobacteria bacterium RBG_16_62_13]|uniref:Uncharacterized protein n=1 Tax=Candidatus Muproteobacteria bacterium RBG_16_62_13 TaxID=1817756 RepID=A0A1F6T742_9PROT|nr:MAG: hypothetical protein A2140_09220 [Candidatus Muproteobacteria bacterium RBG_16_62_13]
MIHSSRRHLLLTVYVVLSLLAVQLLKIHFHTVTDHEPLHSYGHAMELHAGILPAESGHDRDTNGDETGPEKFAILKYKPASGDGTDLPLAIAPLILLVLVRLRRDPWRPESLSRSASGNDVRTPPLRAPPR